MEQLKRHLKILVLQNQAIANPTEVFKTIDRAFIDYTLLQQKQGVEEPFDHNKNYYKVLSGEYKGSLIYGTDSKVKSFVDPYCRGLVAKLSLREVYALSFPEKSNIIRL